MMSVVLPRRLSGVRAGSAGVDPVPGSVADL